MSPISPAERMAHAVVVRAQVASARVTSIDTDAALASPGVLAVYTAKDLAADGLPDFPCGVELKRPNGQKAHQARRPVLVRDRIRAVGEPVAFVVAETLEAAEAAAELVVVETQDVAHGRHRGSGPRAAAAPAVWDEAPDNIAFVWKKGNAGDAITASVACRPGFSSQVSRVAALSLEPRGALGRVDEAGRLVLHASNQSPHILRSALANLLKVPADQVRVVAKDVGGSFGMKSGAYPEDVLVLYAARKLGRPVRWISERRESFLADDHGRDISFDAELGLDRRRPLPGAEGRFHGQCRLLSLGPVAVPLEQHRRHRRRLPDPQHRGRHHRRLHQHDDQRALSRRRPARGDLRHRAADRYRRARARARSLRVAPAQPGAAVGHALRHRASSSSTTAASSRAT